MAAFWAAVGPVVFLLSYFSILELRLSVIDHGRSMLFGFTSALITGYLAGKRPKIEVFWLSFLWIMTRIGEVFYSEEDVFIWLYVLYGVHLALIVAPKFLSAKKLRNWSMSPTLASIGLFPVVVLVITINQNNHHQAFFIFTQLLTLLMFFMAGRMITPLLVRANKDKGIYTQQRVQPFIEAAVMGFIFLSIAIKFLSWWLADMDMTVLLTVVHLIVALLVIIRIIRWNPCYLTKQDGVIWGLLAGYAWLAMAQMIIAKEILNEQVSITSLHMVTIAGLGILSSTIMSYSIQKNIKATAWLLPIYGVIGLLSFAAIARYLATVFVEYYQSLLFLSAVLWSLNFMMVFLTVVKTKK